MKKTNLLFTAALLGLIGCNNDDFTSDVTNNQPYFDGKGVLVDAPALGVTLKSNADTKTYGDDGVFSWNPTKLETSEKGSLTNSTYGKSEAYFLPESVGLCWTGVVYDENGNVSEEESARTSTGERVYTNYQFSHAGWLDKNASKPIVKCGELTNGKYIADQDNMELTATWNGTDWSENTDLDLSKGFFTTENAAVYKGEYLIYFPYNPSFFNAPITAESDKTFTYTEGDKSIRPFESKAFSIGYIKTLKGGDEVAEFSTKTLSSMMKFVFTATSEKMIKDVILYAKGDEYGDGKFIYQKQLNASAVKEQFVDGGNVTLDNIYLNTADDKEYTGSTIVTKLDSKTGRGLTIKEGESVNVIIPVLPTTVKNLSVILVDSEDKSVKFNIQTGDFTFKPAVKQSAPHQLKFNINNSNGEVERLSSTGVVLATGKFEDVYFAVDEETFNSAYTKAKKSTATDVCLELLDKINLTGVRTNYKYGAVDSKDGDNSVTIKTEDPANTLTLGQEDGNNKQNNYAFYKVVFDCNVITKGAGCCEKYPVNLQMLQTSQKADRELQINGGNLSFYFTNTYSGQIELLKEYDEDGDLQNTPETRIGLGASLTVNGANNSGINNQGYLIIESKKGQDPASLILTNEAKFVNESGAEVWNMGCGTLAQDGLIKTSESATFENKGLVSNKGNIFINAARNSFYNNDVNAEFVDRVGSTLSGYGIDNKKGEYISEVNSTDRYNKAIDNTTSGIRPTTILRFVDTDTPSDQTYTLVPNNGEFIKNYNGNVINFENMTTKDLTLKHKNDATTGKAIPTTIGSFSSWSGATLTNAHSALTVNLDLVADKKAYSEITIGAEMLTSKIVKKETEGTENIELEEGLTINGNAYVWKTKGYFRLKASKDLIVEKDIVLGKDNDDFINGRTAFVGNVKCKGDITVNKVVGEFMQEDNSMPNVIFSANTINSAKNLYINAGNEVFFGKNGVTSLGAYNSDGKFVNKGKVNIQNTVLGSAVAAIVWCNQEGSEIGELINHSSAPSYWRVPK